MIKNIIKSIIFRFSSLIRTVAEISDLRINYHCIPQGQNLLIIEDLEDAKRHRIPKSVYFNTRSGKIIVGKNVVFGEDVKLLTGKHFNIEEARRYNKPLHHVPEEGRDIVIGDGCYIGSGAIIIGEVTIGEYSVVGAGSVVTKDVPPYTFVAGNPARVIRVLNKD